jgi:hypothetical protein
MPTGLFAKLVKERPKEPAEVLAKAVAALEALHDQIGAGQRGEREQQQVHKYLGYLKYFLFGDEQGGGPSHDLTKESVLALVREVVKTDFQLLLVQAMALLEFEARKDAAQVRACAGGAGRGGSGAGHTHARQQQHEGCLARLADSLALGVCRAMLADAASRLCYCRFLHVAC